MKKEPKIFIATKAFIISNGKVLILRESKSYDEGTNWKRYDLPGGRLKPGERFDEALIREVKEETGLKIKIGKPFAVNEWRPIVHDEQWQIVGIFFECSSISTKVKTSIDHDAFEWIDPSQYGKYNLIDNLAPIFKTYLKK